MANKMSSFLGANTPEGFVSFFDELYNPYKDNEAYIIKGGPGTGKSTFMKKIATCAETKGLKTERVYCSSDPGSLDALIIPEKGISICDGTSPHIAEPRFPGACENIIDLGRFWNSHKLKEKSDEIRRLFFENSLWHRRSSGYLVAAGRIDTEIQKMTAAYIKNEKIDSFCKRFIYRELNNSGKKDPGEKKRRFISAITPKGNVFLYDTVKALCPRVIGIDDKEGLTSTLITERIGEGAIKNGYSVIYCHCPMRPKTSEHLLIPEKGIALIRINGVGGETECDRIIHSSRFTDDSFRENRSIIRFNSKIKQELINESIRCLKKAKGVHDNLEKIYIDAMDFESLNEFYDNFINELFG